jgi:hypothetical protein
MSEPKRLFLKQRSAVTRGLVAHGATLTAADPAEPSMAWVLKAERGSAELARRQAAFQAWVSRVEDDKTARDREERAREEAGKVYQMTFLPDDKWAMPTDFIACALFAAVQTKKKSPFLRGEQIANINGYTITFTGQRLTQVHADVLMGIAYLAREKPQGYVAEFSLRQFMRMIGREIGTNSRESLRQLLDDLTGAVIRITNPSGDESLSGHILGKNADSGRKDEAEFSVEIKREFCKLFERGFALVDWQQRIRLKKKPLAAWLHLYFSKFHRPVAVKELHRLSGSADELRFFRRRLKHELETLKECGAIQQAFIDDDDVVHVAPVGKPLPARFGTKPQLSAAGDSQPMLPLPGFPPVSDKAIARFRTMFPGNDAEKCLAHWRAWEGSRAAKKPDGAWLGFAKKWVLEQGS